MTRAAIEELGLGAGGDLLKLLGGLLHLGDVSFVKLGTSEGGVSDEGCNIAPEAAAALANAESLLGVAGLARTLTVRIVRAGGGGGEELLFHRATDGSKSPLVRGTVND